MAEWKRPLLRPLIVPDQLVALPTTIDVNEHAPFGVGQLEIQARNPITGGAVGWWFARRLRRLGDIHAHPFPRKAGARVSLSHRRQKSLPVIPPPYHQAAVAKTTLRNGNKARQREPAGLLPNVKRRRRRTRHHKQACRSRSILDRRICPQRTTPPARPPLLAWHRAWTGPRR